jgi:FKBP-type peptidyl-prolyl cis-trans isomerase 2
MKTPAYIPGPSKRDEIVTLEEFISHQPADSYLHSILSYLRPAIVTAIRNDFIVADFNPHALEGRAVELRKEISGLEQRVAALKAQEAVLNRARAADARELEAMADSLEGMAREARRASKAAGALPG